MSAKKIISNTLSVNTIEDGIDPTYIEVKGTALNNDASAYVKIYNGEDKTTTTVTNNDAVADSVAGTRRGVVLVVINRSTLAVVLKQFYDTWSSTDRCSALASKIAEYDETYFVCLMSYDAVGWNSTLIRKLKEYGSTGVVNTATGRFPFAFMGYKGCKTGYAMQRQSGDGASEEPAIFTTYIVGGMMSTNKDGDDGVTYTIKPNITGVTIPSNLYGATIPSLQANFYKNTATEQTSFTCYFGFYFRSESGVYSLIVSGQDSAYGVSNLDIDYGSYKISAIAIFMFKSSYSSTSPQTQPCYASIEIPVVKNGDTGPTGPRGNLGRFFYYAGDWDATNNTDEFVVNDGNAPFFSKAGSSANANYVYNPATNPSGGKATMKQMADASEKVGGQINWNKAPWEVMANDFKYIITEALFTKFALLGGFVVNGDFMISQYGTVRKAFVADGNPFTDSDGTWYPYDYYGGGVYVYYLDIVSKNKTVTSPDGGSAVAYTYFDGFDVKQVDMDYIQFFPTFCVNMATGQSKMGNVEVEGQIKCKSLKTGIERIVKSPSGATTAILASEYSDSSEGYCPTMVMLMLKNDGRNNAIAIGLPPASTFEGCKIDFVMPVQNTNYLALQFVDVRVAVNTLSSVDDYATTESVTVQCNYRASGRSLSLGRLSVVSDGNYWWLVDAKNVTTSCGDIF